MPEDLPAPLAQMSPVPRFVSPAAPPRRPADPGGDSPSPSAGPSPSPTPAEAVAGRRPAPMSGPTDTLTAISVIGEPARKKAPADPKVTAELVVAVVAIVFTGVAVAARFRRRVKMRKPTDRQLSAIADPLARIAARHLPAEALNADLADAVAMTAAVTAYAGAGPVFAPDVPDAGIPADIQENAR